MTLDEIVAHAKKDFVQWGTKEVVKGLLPLLPVKMAFLITNPLSMLLIGKVVETLATRLDWGGYLVFKRGQNHMQAVQYEDSVRDYHESLRSGDKNAQAKALENKLAKFAALASWTT